MKIIMSVSQSCQSRNKTGTDVPVQAERKAMNNYVIRTLNYRARFSWEVLPELRSMLKAVPKRNPDVREKHRTVILTPAVYLPVPAWVGSKQLANSPVYFSTCPTESGKFSV